MAYKVELAIGLCSGTWFSYDTTSENDPSQMSGEQLLSLIDSKTKETQDISFVVLRRCGFEPVSS